MVAATSATVAVMAVVLAGLLMSQRKRFKKKDVIIKIEALLMLLAGMGIGGVVGSLLARLGEWVAEMTAALTSRAFGVAAPASVAIVLFGLFAIHMWKGHKPSTATPWIGLSLAPVGLALLPGGALGDVIDGVFTAIGSAATQAITALLGGA